MHLGRLNLVSLLAALGLFFLPWLELRCQDTGMVQQTGFQAATKKVAMSEEFKKMGEQMGKMGGGAAKTDMSDTKDTKEMPIFAIASIGVAALAFLLALGGAGEPGGSKASSFLAIVALGLAIAQMVLKFPMEKEIMDEMKSKNKPPAGEVDPMAAQMGAQFENMIKVKYLPAFWGYLAALAIPGLLGFIAAPSGRGYPAPPR